MPQSLTFECLSIFPCLFEEAYFFQNKHLGANLSGSFTLEMSHRLSKKVSGEMNLGGCSDCTHL